MAGNFVGNYLGVRGKPHTLRTEAKFTHMKLIQLPTSQINVIYATRTFVSCQLFPLFQTLNERDMVLLIHTEMGDSDVAVLC